MITAKTAVENSYRFYLRAPDSILSGQNPLLAKAMLADNLLGVEEIKDRPIGIIQFERI